MRPFEIKVVFLQSACLLHVFDVLLILSRQLIIMCVCIYLVRTVCKSYQIQIQKELTVSFPILKSLLYKRYVDNTKSSTKYVQFWY